MAGFPTMADHVALRDYVTGADHLQYQNLAAGMVACLLQAHPDWSPAQAQKWFESNASTNIYTSGSSDDWEHQVSGADWSLNAGILRTLWGSTPRVAYFAMKGDKPFNIG